MDEILPEKRRSDHSLLNEMAEMIRNAFIDERLAWGVNRGGKKGRYVPDDRWQESWLKAAKFMMKNEVIDYVEFIHVQFKHRAGAVCIQPNQLYGPAALKRWKAHGSSEELHQAQIYESLSFQKHRFTVELIKATEWNPAPNDPEAPVIFVLLDDTNQLSPLFRLCFATDGGRPDLANQYRDAAMLQYLFGRKAYDVVWKDLLPAGFCQDAVAIRSMFLANFFEE